MALFASAARLRRASAQTAGVAGERGSPLVASGSSLQSRISNLLALALMLTLGIGFLTWYYSRAAWRPGRAHQSAQAALTARAQSEMPLPPLTPVPPAHSAAAADASTALAPEVRMPGAASALVLEPTSAPASTLRPSTLERRLSGAAFASATPSAGGEFSLANSGGVEVLPEAAVKPPGLAQSPNLASGNASERLASLLKSDPATPVSARVLPGQRLLLAKGAFIDCTLETAIDSTLPGLATCVTATDTFGADGTVVLLERGTKLIGETRGQVQQGAARVFVLWTEARTPAGVVVPLDSPGTDELGRSGLPGEVNRHFWQRFGAAILISTIEGAVQASVQATSNGGGTVIYNPSGAQDVMTEVLKSTVNITPTVTKNNGDRIQVLVARDVDFSSVYELRHADSSH